MSLIPFNEFEKDVVCVPFLDMVDNIKVPTRAGFCTTYNFKNSTCHVLEKDIHVRIICMHVYVSHVVLTVVSMIYAIYMIHMIYMIYMIYIYMIYVLFHLYDLFDLHDLFDL